MADTLKLPVGVDSFEKIRRNRFYYIDKTKLIEQLVEMGGEVTLFTRPRRFGKTLNMSMLRSFFEIDADALLFEGLYIAKNKSFCEDTGEILQCIYQKGFQKDRTDFWRLSLEHDQYKGYSSCQRKFHQVRDCML